MKCTMTGKNKLFTILTLVVIMAGMLMLGFLGMNETADFKKSYEVQVGIDQNVNGSAEVVDKAAKDYFMSVGAKPSSFATQTLDDGAVYVYKFNSADNIKEADLKTAVDSAIAASDFSHLVGSVKVYETNVGDGSGEFLYALLALGIAIVAIFLYALITEKVAGGTAVLASAVLSGLIFVSLMAITRVPASPFFTVMLAASVALGAVFSVVMCNRFRENERLAAEQKLSSAEVAAKGFKMSSTRFKFVFAGVLVAAAALAVGGFFGGATYLAFIGAELLIAGISALYSASLISPFIWAGIRGGKAKK